MKKISLTLPKLRINKTFLLVTLGVVIFLSIVAYGAVRSVQASAVQAADTSRVEREAAAKAEANKKYVASLEEQIGVDKAELDTVCKYVKTLDATPAITRSVTVPVNCL